MAFVKLTEETGTRHTGGPHPIWIHTGEIALIYHNGTGTYLSLKNGENTTVTEDIDDVLREVKRQMPDDIFEWVYCECGTMLAQCESRGGRTKCHRCLYQDADQNQ